MDTLFEDENTLKIELRKGNEKAFSFLMDKYHHDLCAYIYGLSADIDASKDIVQNVFIKIWDKKNQLEAIRSVKHFLFKCVYNEYISELRKNKTLPSYEVEQINSLDHLIKEENEAVLIQQIELMKKEIKKLPPRCKTTFLLSKVEGLTNREIAVKMDVSIKTVERQMTKAFKILRTKLQDQFNPLLFLMYKFEAHKSSMLY